MEYGYVYPGFPLQLLVGRRGEYADLGNKSMSICPRCGTRTFLWAKDAHADRRLDAHGRASGRPMQALAFPLQIVPDASGFPLAQQVPMGHAAARRHAQTMLSFTMLDAALICALDPPPLT